jgi:ABC-2 type transport system permease protein
MIFTIAYKELKSMFASPLAWVVLAFVQGFLANIFLDQVNTFMIVQAQLARTPEAPGLTELAVVPMFGAAQMVLLMSIPLLTMRLISEEKRNQTMAMLVSAPISMTQIIVGKFIAMVFFLGFILGLITLMAFSLLAGGSIDIGLVVTNLLGLLLLGMTFSAIGIFISCLTIHPVVAAVLTLAVFLGFWVIGLAASNPDSWLNFVSILKRFEGFMDGYIALADVMFFVISTAVFIGLSIRKLDSERLSA